jgi:hypothetical protein
VAKLPSLQFYPGDWLRDDVSACSLAAQGLWLRMMIIAHDSANYGFLEVNGNAMPPEMIARKCGCSMAEYESLMAELDSAGVPSRSGHGSIYSRRMVRDGAQRKQVSKKRSDAGKAGMRSRWQDGEYDNKPDNKPITNAITKGVTNDNSSSSSSTSPSGEEGYIYASAEAKQLLADQLTFQSQTLKFKAIWNALPGKLQTGEAGIWNSWPKIVDVAVVKHGLDFDAAQDHILHRVKMFANSWKGKRDEFQWSAKTFFGEGHYDDRPETWEQPKSDRKSKDDIFGSLRRAAEREAAK